MVRLQDSWPHRCLAVVVLIMGLANVGAMPCTGVTSGAGSRVQCSHQRRTRFPAHVPDDVTWLDMSFNFLTSLHALNSPPLSRLRHLFVSHNSLTNLSVKVLQTRLTLQTLDLGHNALGAMHGEVFSGLSSLTTLVLSSAGLQCVPDTIFSSLTHMLFLDLSNNSLSSVPTAALQHVSSLHRLDLSRNALTTIGNHSLSPLSSLQYLTLSSNRLTSLQAAAFDGLGKLVTLDLSHNQLALEYAYPPEVFTPLVSLQTLHMEDNDQDREGDYPLGVFGPLQSLKTLFIDTFHLPYFGTAFANLTALKTLNLNAGCQIQRLSNNTFTGFHHSDLQTLSIQRCHALFQVDLCAFCHLPHLTNLDVGYTYYLKTPSLLLAMYGVQNQTLEEVNFAHTLHRGPTILEESLTLYLNNVCIKHLNLQYCSLVGVSSTAFKIPGRLVECLKHLDLSNNLLPYATKSTYFKLVVFGLPNIESLEFSHQRSFTRGSNVHKHPLKEQSNPRMNTTFYINTPPSLRYVNFSGGISDISQLPSTVVIPRGGNVSVLDLSYCGILDCNFTLMGLTGIHTLDISGNDCYTLGPQLFQHMSTLRRLRLVDVYLQEEFLHRLPSDLLKHQPRLKRLVLARNQLESVPSAIVELTSLQDLDLTINLIHVLTLTDRQVLDSLAERHALTVHLRGNPLTCTCLDLDMVRWLGLTTVRLDGDDSNRDLDDHYDDNGRDYPCVLEDGSMSSTWVVVREWRGLWRRCVGLSVFAVSTVAQMTQLLALLLTYVLWSNWTYVRHVWYVVRHVRLPRRADFKYDALLVYASDDLDLARRMKQNLLLARPELRVALPEDETLAGAFYSAELVECMERSWKVGWCDGSLNYICPL